MRLIRIVFTFVCVSVIVGALVAYVSLNALIKKGFETAGPLVAKVETRLGSAEIIPFTGTGKLQGIFIGNPEGSKTPYAIKVDSIHTKILSSSIRTNTLLIQSVKIVDPDISIEGGLTGKNNLTTILGNIHSYAGTSESSQQRPAGEGSAEKETAPSEGKKTVIQDLLITGAQLHWVSSFTLGQEVALPLPEIHLTNLGQQTNGMTLTQLSTLIVEEIAKTATLALKQKHGAETAVSAAFPTPFNRPAAAN